MDNNRLPSNALLTLLNTMTSEAQQPLQDLVNSIYKELGIELQCDIYDKKCDPSDPYTPIINAIKENPEKNRHITDSIIKSLRWILPVNSRIMLSNVYPEDKELALKLLIETSSYYKTYYRQIYYGGPEEVSYGIIYHCPDHYINRNKRLLIESKALMSILKEKGIDNYGFESLWAFYNSYIPTNISSSITLRFSSR